MKKVRNHQNHQKINRKTDQNRGQNVIGTMPAPKRAKWGVGRLPPDPRRRLLGSIFGPGIPENLKKHHPKKHENTGTRKHENVC